ncbi:type VII secretion protein EssC [Defluviitalea phaphyphila]|uniref:type VII secretion protein EssC n=1 Tax=Defluviitalea phaphyphila TaxID=1473580 RepID=UPI00072FD704|nr:type VII secretion protein EssC [Defluviitalea phaphyphila]
MGNIAIHIYYQNNFKEIILKDTDTDIWSIVFENNGDIKIANKKVSKSHIFFEKIQSDWSLSPKDNNIEIRLLNIIINEPRIISYEDTYEINFINRNTKALVWIRNADELNQNFFKYPLENKTITVGGESTNSIILTDSAIGNKSFEIRYENRNYVLYPIDGEVYINEEKVENSQRIKVNDEIRICGNKIIVRKDCLEVFNKLEIKNLNKEDDDTNYPLFKRPPRFYPPIPNETVEIPDPPPMPTKPSTSLISIFLPAIIMVGITIFISIFFSRYGIYSVMFMLGSVIVSVINLLTQKSNYKKQIKIREQKYLEQIDHYRKQFDKQKTIQSESLYKIHPNIDECMKIVKLRDKNLWNRTPQDEDFLDLRIGIGNVPFGVKIQTGKKQLMLEPDILAEEPHKLADEYYNISNVPVTIPIAKNGITGLIGTRFNLIPSVLSLITQLCTHHSYVEVKLVIIYPSNESEQWENLKWLPHVWDDDYKVRFMAKDKISAHQMLTTFNDILKERERKVKNQYDGIVYIPHYVFILADMSLLENEPIMSYLSKSNHNLGYSSIFLANRIEALPRDCKSILEIDTKLGRFIKSSIYAEKEIFIPDKVASETVENFARLMSPIRLKQTTVSTDIPKKITLFEMYKVNSVEELNIPERWAKSEAFSSLAVPLGVGMGGEVLYFNIHEKAHGPHGLVAGTTGSGKSEILQSLIASLAINFHPNDLAFVIIDYKGGGMADLFSGLPHLIGTITNLDGKRIMRALIAIESEMKRRQELFREYGVNHIDNYQKLYKRGQCKEPLPHLIMIFDEFAELKVDQPEFMTQVISAARIGRTLGIHLILATQKPSGVVDDQIWSNSSFKLCLKVKTTQDSMEVLKTPDAADIKYPGRAYLQVGNNELFELFQSAWSGAEYKGNKDNSSNKINISKVDINGKRTLLYSNTLGEEKEEEVSELGVLKQHIIKISEDLNIRKLKNLWTKPIPDKIYISDIDYKPLKDEISAVMGMIDDPYKQTQYPLVHNFIKDGNLLIYADIALGKTTSIQTLIVSLVENYTPDKVCFYILDFGSKVLKSFEQLNHCGDVVTMDEEKKYKYFVKMIDREMQKRKEEFARHSVANYYAYKQIVQSEMPIWIIMLDNYSNFIELYPDEEEFLIRLCRDGASLGIYVVFTVSKPSDIRYKIAMYFKSVIAIGVEDKYELSSIVGKARSFDIPDIPGRGFIKGQPPLEIQISLPFKGDTEAERLKQMREWIKKYSNKDEKIWDRRIPLLPSQFNISELYNTYKVLENTKEEYLPIGLNEDVEVVNINLNKNPYKLITGSYGLGKTNMLKTMLLTLAKKYTPEQVEIYIVDNIYGDLYDYKNLPHVAKYCNTSQNELDEIFEHLKQELELRKNKMIEKKEDTKEEKYILIVIENIIDIIRQDKYNQTKFLENLIKGRSLGVGVWVSAPIEELSSEYHPLAQAVKNLQQGIYFGDLLEQSIFNVRIKYSQEQRKIPGEGYLIIKGQYTYIKTPYATEEEIKDYIENINNKYYKEEVG